MQVSREKFTRKRAICRAHDWKMKRHARLEVFANVSWVRPTRKGLRNSLFGKKWSFALPSLYPQIARSAFQREYPKRYTWELVIFIPTMIYTFPSGFSSTPTFPSLHPWEVASPNTYHTHFECKVRIWCYWEALEGAIHWWIQSGWIAGSEKVEKTRLREVSW